MQHNDNLIISGRSNNDYWVKRYDSDFAMVDSSHIYTDDKDGLLGLSRMIAHEDHLYIVGDYNTFDQQEFGKVFKIDIATLTLENELDISDNEDSLELYGIESLSNDSLVIISNFQPDDQFSHVLRINILDSDLNILQTTDTNLGSGGEFSEFAILKNNDLVVKADAPWQTFCIDLDGNQLWEYSILEIFDHFEPFYANIQELRTDQFGNLLVCGYLDRFDESRNVFSVGYVVNISESGELNWARTYQEGIDGYFLNVAFRSSSYFDNGYIFSGHSFNYYVIEPNQYWVVKTDLDGCITEMNCSDELILSTADSNEINTSIFQVVNNPTQGVCTIRNLYEASISLDVLNVQGQIISSQVNKYSNSISKFILPNSGIFIVRGRAENNILQIETIVNSSR